MVLDLIRINVLCTSRQISHIHLQSVYYLKISQLGPWRLCHSVQGLRTWEVSGRGTGSPAALLLTLCPRGLFRYVWHDEPTRLFTVALLVIGRKQRQQLMCPSTGHWLAYYDASILRVLLPFKIWAGSLRLIGKGPQNVLWVKTASYKTRCYSYPLCRKEGERVYDCMHLWRIHRTQTSVASGEVNSPVHGGEMGVGGRIFTEYFLFLWNLNLWECIISSKKITHVFFCCCIWCFKNKN